MSFPKKGKFFPKANECTQSDQTGECFVKEIASALKRSLGDSRAGVKTVAGWTNANEKTVKNWFSGAYGPSGPHLIALARHSDDVLATFLAMAGREDLMVAVKLTTAEAAITDVLEALRKLRGDPGR